MTTWKTWLKEPLLHFLLIGAAIFAVAEWTGGSAGPGDQRIVLTTAQIEHLSAGYTKAWRRPPTESELKGLVDDWVREEIAVREALAAGLDRDDTLIRRRLRQKLEFLAEDSAALAPPTDPELQAWLDAHGEALRIEPQVAFSQVFLSTARRGAAAEADARALLARLNAAGAGTRPDELGDATMLPPAMALASFSEVDRVFGTGFAKRLKGAPAEAWTGPIRSGFGLHLVRVQARVEGATPRLADVRPAVEREVLAQRRQQHLDGLYARLLAKYTLVVDRPAAGPAASAAVSATVQGSP
jgi:PPIC-type PPIASE domain